MQFPLLNAFLFKFIEYIWKEIDRKTSSTCTSRLVRTLGSLSLRRNTHIEDIQRVCQRGGHWARRPRQNRHLAQRWAGTKGSGHGSLGTLELPTPCSHAFFLSLSLSTHGISFCLQPPIPLLLLLFPSILLPFFCRSSGPIVWTASSTPSSSSGSPLKPSSMVSSSQTLLHSSRRTRDEEGGQSDSHTLS